MMVGIGPLQHVHGDPEESGGEPTVHAPLHRPSNGGVAKIVTGAMLDASLRQYAARSKRAASSRVSQRSRGAGFSGSLTLRVPVR